MKIRALHLFVILSVALATTGSSCLNEEFIVTANATVEETFPINAGSSTSGSGVGAATVVDLLPESLSSDDVDNISNYDLKVIASGTYSGSASGTIAISSDGITFTPYGTLSQAPWDSLKTLQSVLEGSKYLTVTPAGKAALEAALNAFKTDDQATVWVRFSWAVTQGPVPSGLSVTVQLLSQINFKVSVS